MNYIRCMLILALSFTSFSNNVFDGKEVTLSGVVKSASADSFILQMKSTDTIEIEMDDWDWYKEGHKILPGDSVIVHGKIDHDFLEEKKIEAGSVYVSSINTYYYASSDDEEEDPVVKLNIYDVKFPHRKVDKKYLGHIRKIDKESREFVLDTGDDLIDVDFEKLSKSPIYKDFIERISNGDLVKVYGHVDHNFFVADDFDAHLIVQLVAN